MLHTKFRGNRSAGFGEDFEEFLPYMAWRPSWSCDQHHILIYFHFQAPKIYIQNLVKNGQVVSEKSKF